MRKRKPTTSWFLLSLTLLLAGLSSGCATHMLPRAHEHMKIRWAANYVAAQQEAQRDHKPILVVLVAGEIDGPCCYGGDAMRGDALSDARVIELVNREMVPVWINVRNQPVPAEALKQGLVTATLDAHNRVTDTFSRCFFNRSLVLSPDGKTLLNPQIGTLGKGVGQIATEGKLGYAEINAGDYLVMMWKALARFRGEDGILLQQPRVAL